MQEHPEFVALVVFQGAVQVAIGGVPGQVYGAQHQGAGLVPGVVVAMAEEQLFGMEAADGPADVVAQGAQAGFAHERLRMISRAF